MSLKIQDGEAMNIFLARVRKAARDLKNAGRPINNDEVAYQMLTDLPANYDGIVHFYISYQIMTLRVNKLKRLWWLNLTEFLISVLIMLQINICQHLLLDKRKTKTFIQRQNNENKM